MCECGGGIVHRLIVARWCKQTTANMDSGTGVLITLMPHGTQDVHTATTLLWIHVDESIQGLLVGGRWHCL